MKNIPQDHGYYAHGTNAQSLDTILATRGVILPGNDLRERGIIPQSGESGGTTGLNSKVVSTIALDYNSQGHSYAHNAVTYAESATRENAITPSNIDERIKHMERILSDSKHIDYAEGSHYENCIKAQRQRLVDLKGLRQVYSEMTLQEMARVDLLASIPVVIIGKNQKKFESFIYSDIPGEVGLPLLKAEIIAAPSDYTTTIQSILDERESQIKIVPMEKLEDLQRDYLQNTC